MANQNEIRTLVREAVIKALTESKLAEIAQSPTAYTAPWTGVEYESHPSRQQFDINEAAVNIGELIEFAEAQSCSIEQNKSCDHCGLCRSLGF